MSLACRNGSNSRHASIQGIYTRNDHNYECSYDETPYDEHAKTDMEVAEERHGRCDENDNETIKRHICFSRDGERQSRFSQYSDQVTVPRESSKVRYVEQHSRSGNYGNNQRSIGIRSDRNDSRSERARHGWSNTRSDRYDTTNTPEDGHYSRESHNDQPSREYSRRESVRRSRENKGDNTLRKLSQWTPRSQTRQRQGPGESPSSSDNNDDGSDNSDQPNRRSRERRKKRPQRQRRRNGDNESPSYDNDSSDSSAIDEQQYDVQWRRQRLKLQKFDGTDSWENWWSHFENCATYNRWTTVDKLAFLKGALPGSAAQVLWDTDRQATGSLRRLTELLRSRYSGQRQAEKHKAELQVRIKRPGETLNDLHQDVRRLTALAYPQLTAEGREQIGIDRFTDALGDAELALKVKERCPKSLDEALCVAL